MKKIPKLKEAMDLKRTAVSEMTKGIMDEIITNIEYQSVPEKNVNDQIVPQKKEVNIISSVIDELVLDQVLAQMMLEEPGNEINAISIGELQSKIEVMIDSIAANGFKDLTPSEMNKCHHIELIDKNQQPLRQRMRPIPYSQQKSVSRNNRATTRGKNYS